MGASIPWEMLGPRMREAWLEVEAFLNDEPECKKCGNPLLCGECDDLSERCDFCGDELVCPTCDDYMEKVDAKDEPRDPVPTSASGVTTGSQGGQ